MGSSGCPVVASYGGVGRTSILRWGLCIGFVLMLLVVALLAVPAARASSSASPGLASVAAYRGGGASSEYLSDASTGAISGIVRDGTGTALGGIWVAIYSGAFDYVTDTSTDAFSGQYFLPDLTQGTYRVKFFDDAGFFLPQWFDHVSKSSSAKPVRVVNGDVTQGIDATMIVHVVLLKPTCPRSVRHGKRFTASGTVQPQFRAGTKTVALAAYRLTNRKWKLYRRYAAVNANSGENSKYSARIKLTRRGKYRFKAMVKATAVWTAAKTGYSRTLTVK